MATFDRAKIEQSINTLNGFQTDKAVFNEKQHAQFYEDLVTGSSLLEGMDYRPMERTSEQWVYNKSEEDPLFVPDFESRAVASTGVTNRLVQIDAKILRGRITLRDELLTQNLAGEDLMAQVQTLVAKECAKQIARGFLLGDTALTVAHGVNATEQAKLSYYKQWDGLLKRGVAAGNRINASNADITATLIGDILAAVPDTYQENIDQMILYVTPKHFRRIQNAVANRAATDGPWMFEGKNLVSPQGLVIKMAQDMTSRFQYGTGGTAGDLNASTRALLFRPEDYIIGNYAGGMRWEVWRDYENFQNKMNFEVYLGFTSKFPTGIVDIYNVRF